MIQNADEDSNYVFNTVSHGSEFSSFHAFTMTTWAWNFSRYSSCSGISHIYSHNRGLMLSITFATDLDYPVDCERYGSNPFQWHLPLTLKDGRKTFHSILPSWRNCLTPSKVWHALSPAESRSLVEAKFSLAPVLPYLFGSNSLGVIRRQFNPSSGVEFELFFSFLACSLTLKAVYICNSCKIISAKIDSINKRQ